MFLISPTKCGVTLPTIVLCCKMFLATALPTPTFLKFSLISKINHNFIRHFLSFVISQNTKNNICTSYPPARVMKQVVLFFEIKFTTVVKITFRKRGQMRQANVNGRKIYKYKYINSSTRSSNSRANTKNPCTCTCIYKFPYLQCKCY